MPTPHILNIVQRAIANSPRGVQQTSLMQLGDLNNLTDPLMQNMAAANKAATSIPSMFARILFFRTAFQSIINPTHTNSVYAKYVSDCLDLLESIFNYDPAITFVRWNKAGQLATLNNTILHDALSTQLNKFMPSVTDIYLIKKNGRIIGGTSPFTIVYTSPNWNNPNPVRMLQDRTPKFREFMYKFADAYAAAGNVSDLVGYINRCKPFDPQYRMVNFGGQWPIATLATNYPPVQWQGNSVMINNAVGTPLYLFAKNQQNFDSGMFLASQQQPFNQITTPLLLVSNPQPLCYYDNVTYPGWGHGFVEVEGANDDTTPRPLPNCNLRHSYLTPINLLEDCLIKVPYAINANRWKGVININNETEGCMLPLKPMLFKYYTVAEVMQMLTLTVDDINRKVTVSLNIPVRNTAGTINNHIEIKREYAYGGIKEFPTMDHGYTVGIAPFYANAGRYHVVQGEEVGNLAAELNLYKCGTTNAIAIQPTDLVNDNAIRLKVYTISNPNQFDYIRVIWGGNKGVLLPDFISPVANGMTTYTYGVDFGTTNTHIAYTKDGVTAVSFNNGDYKWHVEYLSNEGKTGNDSIKTALARTFFPDHCVRDYEFPIRTVVSEHGNLGVRSKVFEDASIGFKYSKEYTIPRNITYNAKLKWDFDTQPGNAHVMGRVLCFCEEILMMIKNHWAMQTDANHANPPRVALSYPAAMINFIALKAIWEQKYKDVFNVQNANLFDVTESLAPCRTAIVGGAGMANGMLNIDIGGGTTDLQYYKNYNNRVISLYNSIKFAGDDLWGKCYENVDSGGTGAGITSNNFTNFARGNLANAQLEIGGDTKNIADITIDNPKEFVGVLLKDSQHNFANSLRIPADNICRKILFLHYAAILRYAVKWLQKNGVTNLPHKISFSGMGSKYLELLFPTPYKFAVYSKRLLEVFSEQQVGNITIDLPVANPKNITAEGSCLYAAAGNAPMCTYAYYLGCDAADNVTYGNVGQARQKVIESLADFIDKFNSIGDCSGTLAAIEVIRITDNEKRQLLNDAVNSYANMVNFCGNGHAAATQVQEAVFFWALKDSLWKL